MYLQILERLAEINYMAEEFLDVGCHSIRPNGNNEWIALEERWIAGVRVKPGSVGTTVREGSPDSPIVISWALDTPSKNLTVWDILTTVVLDPAVDESPTGMKKYANQVCAIAELLWEFSETTNHFPPKLFELVQPTTSILRV
jgi:hypothetical protein